MDFFSPCFRNEELRHKWGNRINLLYVGRVFLEKDLDILRDAMEILNPEFGQRIRWIITGDGQEFYLEPFAVPKNKEFAYDLFQQIFHHPNRNLSYVVHDRLSYMNDHHQAFRKIETAEGYFEGLDQASLDTEASCNQCGHLSLQLCMSQPHITMMSVGMQSVSHIRSTSDSKSFFVEGKKRWRWHLYSSLLIHSLGKYPFYDRRITGSFNLTTNKRIEFELIWIALSGGPMGFGDCNKAVSASSQLFSQIHFEENTLRFIILRREKELSSRIVLYSKSPSDQVTVDGEAIAFFYQKQKVEFEINDGFVGQVTVCVTRK